MATKAIRKLDLKVDEIVEIDGIQYEVVPIPESCEVTIEPVVITMDELDRREGVKPISQEEFDRLSAGLPSDGEG